MIVPGMFGIFQSFMCFRHILFFFPFSYAAGETGDYFIS